MPEYKVIVVASVEYRVFVTARTEKAAARLAFGKLSDATLREYHSADAVDVTEVKKDAAA